jgi:hypothetical protein
MVLHVTDVQQQGLIKQVDNGDGTPFLPGFVVMKPS